MTVRKRIYLLAVIAAASLIVISVWLVPRVLGIYYLEKGGQLLEKAIHLANDIDENSIICAQESTQNDESRLFATEASSFLKKAIYVNPRISYTYLILGHTFCILGKFDEANQNLQEYTNMDPENPLGHVEIISLFLRSCQSDTTRDSDKEFCTDGNLQSKLRNHFKASQIESEELLNFGEKILKNDNYTAMRWYSNYLLIFPENQAAWILLGRICQDTYLHSGKTCEEFHNLNNENLIVDPEFEFSPLFTIWEPFEYIPGTTIYGTTECPDLPDRKCAEIEIIDTVPKYGAGLYQCIKIEKGKKYTYSGWIKVDIEANGKWRPLYWGGIQKGQPIGRQFGNEPQYDSSDWKYWEYTFQAPSTDAGKICFYPVRLEAVGKAWFNSIELRMTSQ